MEISVSFLPGETNQSGGSWARSVLVTYPLVNLQVFCHTSVNTHSLPLHQVWLAVFGGDTFLVTSCRQARVPAVSIVRILSILGCLVLHVSHHFDLEVLDQLHFSLV